MNYITSIPQRDTLQVKCCLFVFLQIMEVSGAACCCRHESSSLVLISVWQNINKIKGGAGQEALSNISRELLPGSEHHQSLSQTAWASFTSSQFSECSVYMCHRSYTLEVLYMYDPYTYTHNMVNRLTWLCSQISVPTNQDRKEAEMVMCDYRRVCRCVSEPDWGFCFSAAKKKFQ